MGQPRRAGSASWGVPGKSLGVFVLERLVLAATVLRAASGRGIW